MRIVFKLRNNFDFRETESEQNVSIISLKSVDNPCKINHRTEPSLEEWLEGYDKLLDDTSVNKKNLYQQIIAVQKKVCIL